MEITNSEITIRRADADDELALRKLAMLDSAPEVPAGPLLVAEIDGRIAAALSLADWTSIADPFVPTVELLELLRVRGRSIMRLHGTGRRRMREFTAPRAARAY